MKEDEEDSEGSELPKSLRYSYRVGQASGVLGAMGAGGLIGYSAEDYMELSETSGEVAYSLAEGFMPELAPPAKLAAETSTYALSIGYPAIKSGDMMVDNRLMNISGGIAALTGSLAAGTLYTATGLASTGYSNIKNFLDGEGEE